MPSEPESQTATPAVGRVWSTSVLLLCVALIVYASLYPFSGWQIPVETSWQTLWSRYYAEFDVFINFLTYVPLGFLAAAAWALRGSKTRAFVFALLCGAMLSLMLEVLQLYLPTRVTSLIDWLANSAGTASEATFVSAGLARAHFSCRHYSGNRTGSDPCLGIGTDQSQRAIFRGGQHD